MATVERRRQTTADGSPGDVRWRVRWRDPSGKQRSRTFTHRRDADRWRTEVEHQVLAGSYIDHAAGRITLKAYAEQWRTSRSWAPNTATRVESVFRLHLYPVLGDRPIGSIRPSDVQSWVAKLSKTLAPSTVGVVATNLSGVMKAAVLDRIIPSSPCVGIDLPRVARAEIVPPTPAQLELLVSHSVAKWRAAVMVGAGLGLRVSEALALTVDRVDFLRHSVRVDRQITQHGGAVELSELLKTAASYRTVPLPEVVGRALAVHIEQFGTGPGGAIFHQGGQLVRRQRAGDAIERARVRANAAAPKKADPPLPVGVRFHDLRHFYASMLIEGGASVKTVQRRLGHASAVETLDTYGHLWPESEEQTRATVERVLADRVASLWPEVAE